jgi:hypothetical protein
MLKGLGFFVPFMGMNAAGSPRIRLLELSLVGRGLKNSA